MYFELVACLQWYSKLHKTAFQARLMLLIGELKYSSEAPIGFDLEFKSSSHLSGTLPPKFLTLA